MKKIPTTGASGLVGAKARVVSKLGPSEEAQYLVEADGELWSANLPDMLGPGDIVIITDVKGIRLTVKRIDSQSVPSP